MNSIITVPDTEISSWLECASNAVVWMPIFVSIFMLWIMPNVAVDMHKKIQATSSSIAHNMYNRGKLD